MVYVAVRATHPVVTYVALALAADRRRRAIGSHRPRHARALAASIPLALLVSWFVSTSLSTACQRDRASGGALSSGDLTRPIYDHGSDELGTVARALDDPFRQLGAGIEELSRDRGAHGSDLSAAWSKACSSSIDRDDAARESAAQQMLRVEPSAAGRPYLEVIRHPDIAAQLRRHCTARSADRS
jgi:methyl-accepting chemotaxis protein